MVQYIVMSEEQFLWNSIVNTYRYTVNTHMIQKLIHLHLFTEEPEQPIPAVQGTISSHIF